MTSEPGRASTDDTPRNGITSTETDVSDNETTPPIPKARERGARRAATAATLVGVLLVGGTAGATLFGPLTATAASPTAQPSTPAASTQPGSGSATTPAGTMLGGPGGPMGGGNHGFGRNETVSDISVVAKAIGISEADLQTALDGGQTVAAVAKAHNVPVQTVIDALVADGQSELAADVTAGRLTQAQADAQKAQVTQRATDQVNGTMLGGPGGPMGGPGGPGGYGH
jgi:hypothetical protein